MILIFEPERNSQLATLSHLLVTETGVMFTT